MKLQGTLLLICMILFEAFQASTALQCYACNNNPCTTKTTCEIGLDRCMTVKAVEFGKETIAKSCANQQMCDVAEAARKLTGVGEVKCCGQNLCNGAKAFTQSLLLLLVPLLSSILFI